MKRIMCLMMVGVVLTGCGATTTENKTAVAESESIVVETENEAVEEMSEESNATVEVDEGLLTTEIVLPKEWAGDKKQEELDALAKDEGFISVVLNADGSVTYKMTRQRHKEMLSEMKAKMTNFSEYIGTEGYENVTDINANDDLTEFTVSTKSEELSMEESFLSMYFFMAGGMYSTFSNEPIENIKVVYINADTKEIIKEVNSKEEQ